MASGAVSYVHKHRVRLSVLAKNIYILDYFKKRISFEIQAPLVYLMRFKKSTQLLVYFFSLALC